MTGRMLCRVPECFVPGRHETDCRGDCGGCLPGLAMDGGLVCLHHHERAMNDLEQLPGLDDDLGAVLVRRSNMLGTYVTGSRDSVGIVLDQDVMDARDYLRNRLTNLAGFVCEERGLTGPTERDVRGLTAWLERHGEWMSANETLAPVWGRQVANLRAEGRRWAYRSRQTSIKLGECPMTGDDGAPCGRAVRHDPSDYAGQNVTCRGCGTTGTVDWWQHIIWGDGAYLPANEVAALLTTRYNRVVPPSTIRAWATKQIITRHDTPGGTVYDLTEVRAHADTIWEPAA